MKQLLKNKWLSSVLTAVVLVASTGLAVSGCEPPRCGAECEANFYKWVKRGAPGSVPAGAAGFCAVNPDNKYCP